MSSSEAPQSLGVRGHSRRSLLRGLASALLIAPVLAACADGSGFRPVYGSLGNGPGVEDKLKRVAISTIPGRPGQRIRNELIFANTGGGLAEQPAYRLDISLRASTTTSLVSSDGNSASQILQLDATFRLVDLKDNRTLLQGISQGRAAFDRVTAIYANVRASSDAEDRAAKSVATDLKSRLAAFMSTLPS